MDVDVDYREGEEAYDDVEFPEEWYDDRLRRNKKKLAISDSSLISHDETNNDPPMIHHPYYGDDPKILIEYAGVPNEIVAKIFSFIEYKNLKHPRGVCWRWYWFVGERVFEPMKLALKSHNSYIDSVMNDAESEEFLFGRTSACGIHPNTLQPWITSPLLKNMQSMKIEPQYCGSTTHHHKFLKALHSVLPKCDGVRYLDLSLNDLNVIDTTSLRSICHPGDLFQNNGVVPLPPHLETLSFNRHLYSGTFLSSDPFVCGTVSSVVGNIADSDNRIKLIGHSMVKSPYQSIKSLHLNSVDLRNEGIGMTAFTDYLPNLTSLSLASVHRNDGAPILKTILDSSRLISKLVNLSIGLRDCGAAFSHLDTSIPQPMLQQLLDRCESLRTLTVGSLSPLTASHHHILELKSTNITHLNISFGLANNQHAFSLSLIVPSLKSLVIMALLISSLEYIHLGWMGYYSSSSSSSLPIPTSDSLIQCHSPMKHLNNLKVWLGGTRYKSSDNATKTISPRCIDLKNETLPSLTRLHVNIACMISGTSHTTASTTSIITPRIRLNLSKLEKFKFATSSDPLLNVDFSDVCLPSLRRLEMKAPRVVLGSILSSKLYSKSKWLEKVSLSLSSHVPSELALHHIDLGDIDISELFSSRRRRGGEEGEETTEVCDGRDGDSSLLPNKTTPLSEMRFKNVLPNDLSFQTCKNITSLSVLLSDCISVNFVDKQQSFILLTTNGESTFVTPTLLDVLMSKSAAHSMPFLLDLEISQTTRDPRKDSLKRVVIHHRMLATLSISCGTIPVLLLPSEKEGHSKFNNSLHTLSLRGPYEPGVCKKWMSAFTSLISLELNVTHRLRSGLISSPSLKTIKFRADCSFGKDRKIAIDTPNLTSLSFEPINLNAMLQGNFPSMDVRMCAPKCDFVVGQKLLKSTVRVCRSRDLEFPKSR